MSRLDYKFADDLLKEGEIENLRLFNLPNAYLEIYKALSKQ
jgi:hypothetical protein